VLRYLSFTTSFLGNPGRLNGETAGEEFKIQLLQPKHVWTSIRQGSPHLKERNQAGNPFSCGRKDTRVQRLFDGENISGEVIKPQLFHFGKNGEGEKGKRFSILGPLAFDLQISSPFLTAFTFVVVVLGVIDLADKREDIQLFAPLNVLGKSRVDGFLFRAVVPYFLGFPKKAIVNCKICGQNYPQSFYSNSA
jgi:hypothetical protein